MTTHDIPDAKVLLALLQANGWFLDQNLAGMTQDESLRRPEPAGNPLNWVVGHIVYWRRRMLMLLGEGDDEPWPGWEIYDSRADGARPWNARYAHSLDDLTKEFHETQEDLADALQDVLATQRLASPHGEETVAERMLKLLSHEMYHVGQTGLLRRLLGHEGAV